jgi:hypothetical protein
LPCSMRRAWITRSLRLTEGLSQPHIF